MLTLMINRPRFFSAVRTALERAPICALLGPRQCGKTTLARMVAGDSAAEYFDLESAEDLPRLENPMLALRDVAGLVVIDEIQRKPELFETLRVLVDRPGGRGRFLILGSASPDLIQQASESLAGRVEFVELGGFDLLELGQDARDTLWNRGGFPRSYLSASDSDSHAWRDSFIRTFLERDIPQLGIQIPAITLRRFWTMLAHYHGQTWNASELARSLGVTSKTVDRYLDILCGTFMVRRLPPWHENLSKRQVKAPKIYLRDSGILHTLLGLPDRRALLGHPKLGASWEGFMLEQVLRILRTPDAYFWGTYAGAELDLLFVLGGKRHGVEFKWGDAPSLTRSMRTALDDLSLEHLWVVYPGPKRYRQHDRVTFLPAVEIEAIARE